MSLLSWIFQSDDNSDDKPCNVSGHDYEQTRGPNYHTSGIPGFIGDTFKVRKKIPEECTKCGRYRQREEKVGNIKVDTETDELTVIQ